MRNQLIHPKVKPLTNLDLALPDSVLKRVAAPALVDLSAPHRLFNPMAWQKAADGHLIKVDSTNIGPNAVTITKMQPLWLKLTLDNVLVSDAGNRCVIGIEKEAAANLRDRNKTQKYCSPGTKTDTFTLRDVKIAPDNPTNVVGVVLELNDTGQRVTVTKDQLFRRVDGYTVDLKYAPENKTWTNRRVGNALSFNNEEYNIVAITENEVVLSAKSNQKKWTIKYSASAAS
jgi:hypothetical protein